MVGYIPEGAVCSSPEYPGSIVLFLHLADIANTELEFRLPLLWLELLTLSRENACRESITNSHFMRILINESDNLLHLRLISHNSSCDLSELKFRDMRCGSDS